MRNNQKSFTRYHSATGFAHLFLLFFVILVAIGAIGYLAYQNAQLKKQTEETTTTPETTETLASPTPDQTAEWQTHSNSSNEYSLKIPSDWEVETISEDKVRFYPPGEKGKLRYATSVTISVFSIDKQNINNSIRTEEQYKEWVAKPVSEDKKKNEYKIGQMKIDGLDGVQLVQQTLPSDAIGPAYNIITWVQKDNKNFYIYLGNEKVTAESLKSIYNQILSTFKFLE